MFFCRHHLLRAPAQRHFTSLVTTRNALARAAPPLPRSRPGHARLTHTPTPPLVTQDASLSEASDSNVIPPPLVPGDPNPDTTPPVLAQEADAPPPAQETEQQDDDEYEVALPSMSSPEDVAAFKEKFRKNPLGIYLAVRKGGVRAITTLSSEFFAGALWHCVHTDQPQYLPMFVEDAIVVLDQRPGKIRGRKLMEILFSTLNHKRLLSKADFLELLRCIERNKQLRYLNSVTRATVARALWQYPADDLDRELLHLLVPLLLDKLPALGDRALVSRSWASTAELESTDRGVAVPRLAWPLYRMAVRLATLGDKKASDVLAALVERQLIDSRAIEDTDLTSTDLVYVTLSVLFRTCLRYGWFGRASKLLFTVVTTMDEFSPPLTLLVEDWLSQALSNPRQIDMENAASAIALLMQRAPGYVIPDEILHRFYQGAFDCGTPELAETVYRLSRRVRHCSYPPPRDASLLRLVVFLGTKSRNVHLARLLVQDVVEQNIPLSPPVRAPFIAQTAALGLATHARALWEQYSVGPAAPYVVGSGPTMLRVVSLFARVADQAMEAARQRLLDDSGAHRENPEDRASADDQDGSQPATASPRTLSQGQGLPASADAPPLPLPAPPPPHADAQDSDGGEPPSGDGSDASEDAEGGMDERASRGLDALSHPELLAREADLRAFAVRVYDAYRTTKLPLADAAHHDLTSLARGASIIGRDSESLEVFMLLKKLGRTMDLRDVNIALAMVSRRDPAAGAEYILQMETAGIAPDTVSYGTVIHWAAHHGDTTLVSTLIQRAKDAGIEGLSFKTLASLLHATVSGKVAESTSPQARLQYAQDIVNMMLDQGHRPTPNIGKDCIVAALQADNPIKAFKFWQRYVKNKVDMQDNTQTRLRGSIARLVRDHMHDSWMRPELATTMLYELGYPADAFLLARRLPTLPSTAELAAAASAGRARKG